MVDKAESDDPKRLLGFGFKPRRVQRAALGGPTHLTPQNLHKIEVNVRNISTCGFMAESAGAVHAQVRWQVGARMGGMFLDPISLSRCEWAAEKAETRNEPA